MNPMKVLCAYGEAGAIVTDDALLHEKMESLRYAGTVNREDCHYPSLNGRIDTLQAAMLLVNLQHLESKISQRRAIASYYSQTLPEYVTCPQEEDGYFNVYYTYTILADRRNQLQSYLADMGIETKIQHPILMPYHAAYKHLRRPEIPTAESLIKQILCIPTHENLTMDEAKYVVDNIKNFYEES